MKSYKIMINVSDVGGVYSAESLEEAERIAEEVCENIYVQLRGNCNVIVRSIEELKG
jgi:hypothetical protein